VPKGKRQNSLRLPAHINNLSSYLYHGMNCCQSFSISCIHHSLTNSVNRRPICLPSNRLHYSCTHSPLSSQRQHILPASALSVNSVMVDPVTSVRYLGIYIDADLSMRTRTANRVVVFRRTLPAVTDSPAITASHISDTGGSFSSVVTGLWQRHTGRPTCLPCTPTPVSI